MRAALTARAIRTGLGGSIPEVVESLFAGHHALREDPVLLPVESACRLGAPVVDCPKASRHSRFLRRMALFGVEVGRQAFGASGHEGGDRLGLFVGTGRLRASWDELLPALEEQALDGRGSWERGFKRLHPFWMLQYLSNNAHALLAGEVRALGEGVVFGGANAGAQALCGALAALESHVIDLALVVAYDSLLEPETLLELGARETATRSRLAGLAAPYSVDAAGYVPGEAAAAVVLERPANAAGRAIAFVEAAARADGSTGEPQRPTVRASVARVAQRDEVVDGAARARPELDLEEREILADVVGSDARLVGLSAALGECGAAKSLLQAALLPELLRMGKLPAIAGLSRPARGPLHPVTETSATTAKSALGLCTAAPGLVGAIRVSLG